jgi:hypothetical protein
VPPSIAAQPQFSGATFSVHHSGNCIMFIKNQVGLENKHNNVIEKPVESFEKVDDYKEIKKQKAWWENE